MSKPIYIFDTTLRDGEQSPGAKLNVDQKLQIARQLAYLGVDVIEAGFAASSPGDMKAIAKIAAQIQGPVITGLCRAKNQDIDSLWQALKKAERPRIHIVLGSSDVHIEGKFKSSREKVMERGVAAVQYAKKFCQDVEYSTEDAVRSDFVYLCRVVEAVIKAGATVVNIPDTVGYANPADFGDLVRRLREAVPATDQVTMSVHCHNDMGLATANTLAAVKNGIDQVEVTVNGIGERAGNTALEEVVMALYLHNDYYQAHTRIHTEQIGPTSSLVSSLTGISVQPNKAYVGANAFRHSSGIHQDGILKARTTYEIVPPQTLGLGNHVLELTARSGRHAVRHSLQQMGITIPAPVFEDFFAAFLDLADQQKQVSPRDLLTLYENKFKIAN